MSVDIALWKAHFSKDWIFEKQFDVYQIFKMMTYINGVCHDHLEDKGQV